MVLLHYCKTSRNLWELSLKDLILIPPTISSCWQCQRHSPLSELGGHIPCYAGPLRGQGAAGHRSLSAPCGDLEARAEITTDRSSVIRPQEDTSSGNSGEEDTTIEIILVIRVKL